MKIEIVFQETNTDKGIKKNLINGLNDIGIKYEILRIKL